MPTRLTQPHFTAAPVFVRYRYPITVWLLNDHRLALSSSAFAALKRHLGVFGPQQRLAGRDPYQPIAFLAAPVRDFPRVVCHAFLDRVEGSLDLIVGRLNHVVPAFCLEAWRWRI